MHLLEFIVENRRHAVPVASAERVYLAAEITPLVNAPPAVLGLVNVHGRILPVVSLRKRLGLPERAPRPGDRMIVVHTGKRAAVLLVDAVPGVLDVGEQEFVSGQALFPGSDVAGGVANQDGDLLLVEDLESIFENDVEACLTEVAGEPDDARPAS